MGLAKNAPTLNSRSTISQVGGLLPDLKSAHLKGGKSSHRPQTLSSRPSVPRGFMPPFPGRRCSKFRFLDPPFSRVPSARGSDTRRGFDGPGSRFVQRQRDHLLGLVWGKGGVNRTTWWFLSGGDTWPGQSVQAEPAGGLFSESTRTQHLRENNPTAQTTQRNERETPGG